MLSADMWMWATLLCVVSSVHASTTVDCDLSIDGDTYRKETLVSDMLQSTGLAVDYATNLLYYNYNRKGEHVSAKLDLRTRAVNEIEELTGECRFAVDQELQQVHAGCQGVSDRRGAGLYQFDSNIDQFSLAGERGQPIWYIYHYNGNLYYSVGGSLLLLKFRKGHSARVNDLPSQVTGFVIDKHKDWIFYNYTGVYRQQPGAVEATLYPGFLYPWALAVDAGGTAHVCDYWRSGIYRLAKQTLITTKLLGGRCCGLTFDHDNNIIFSDNHRIYRLVKC